MVRKYSPEEIDDTYRRKIRFEKDFKNRWETEKLDAFICPATFHCAFLSNEKENEPAFQSDYNLLWNLVHYPAGVVPVTEVLEKEA